MARVLVVDDEVFLLSILKILLTAEGYNVQTFQDATKAVDCLKDSKFDLVVSDLRMGPTHGMDLLQIAKETYPDMPVIMMTAYWTKETIARARGLGAYAYLRKPFKNEEFLAVVKDALKKK